MKKKLIALIAAVTMLVSVPYDVNLTQTNAGIEIVAQKTEALAATKTITVKNADVATATKIHKQLVNGKALTLKVKGNASASQKLINQINTKIKKVNKQGVVFQYKKGKTKSGYTTYNISSDQAGTYQYAVKYIKKLYGMVRKYVTSNENIKNYSKDLAAYPNEEKRRLRWAYDYVCQNIYPYMIRISDYDYTSVDAKSYEKPKTKSSVWVDYDYEEFDKLKKKLLKSVSYKYTFSLNAYDENWNYINIDTKEIVRTKLQTEEWKNNAIEKYRKQLEDEGYSNTYVYCQSLDITAKGYSFKEFCNLSIAKKLAKKVRCNMTYDDAVLLLYKKKNFCDLSDAMKVYAIAASGYFECNWGRPEYGMVYDYTWQKYYGKKGMKILYQNKAIGVCEVYAAYEHEVWKSLGIKSFINTSYEISHAWSVVAAKNSKGKVLWIPFDYGIGPAEGLSVSDSVREKYLKTENMRYKLYLRNIKGAPKKKNFKNSDFN